MGKNKIRNRVIIRIKIRIRLEQGQNYVKILPTVLPGSGGGNHRAVSDVFNETKLCHKAEQAIRMSVDR